MQRGVDLDVAALCIDVVESRLLEGSALQRPDVHALQWADMHNEATILNVHLPTHWPVHFWTVLCWFYETGQLPAGSDPLAALLEPLQCYAALGPDGSPRPEGEDVNFFCQCYLPFDPTMPTGQAGLIIGHDVSHRDPFVLRLHPRLRSEEPLFADFAPLFALEQRARTEQWRPVDVNPLEWHYVGCTDRVRATPPLWVYLCTAPSRLHHNPLLVDADGQAWSAHADSRTKVGYRLRAMPPLHALVRAGHQPLDEAAAW